jgi:EpsD family peptidyl-prolyl cis-trans isomerase
MKTYKIKPSFAILPLLVAIALFSGCGKKDDAAKSESKEKAATQVAAKVNAEEITVHQVNSVLSRNPNIPPEAAAKAKHEILSRLIDQQLAKQQAVEQKLDRKPAVMQAIEAARSEILARAYIDQITAAQPKPTPDDIKKYYNDHPELFSERRIFDLEEIVVAPQPELTAKLREQSAKARSLQEIAAWLKTQTIQCAPNRGVRPAEALPLELLPKLQSMKDGEIRLIENNEQLYVFRLAGSKKAPVTEAQASPRIQLFLFNQQAREAVTAEIKRLKGAANIEYVGEFSGGAAAAEEKAKAEAAAKAQADAKAKAESELAAKEKAEARAKEQAEADARADALSKARKEAEAKAKSEPAKSDQKGSAPVAQDTIDKGIRGLK